jgi:hypothetical protein
MRQRFNLSRWLIMSLLIAMLVITPAALAQVETEGTPPGSEAEAVAGELVDIAQSAAESTFVAADNLISALVQPPQSDLGRIVLIIGGVILLIAGWRIYEYIIILAGIFVGAAIALSLVVTDSTLITLLVMFIGGIIGALVSMFLYYVAAFLIGAYVGIALTGTLAAALSLTPVSPIALLIGAIVGGVIMLGLSVELLIFLSAIVGAQMLALGLGLGAVWVIIFAIIGLVVQFVLARSFHYDFRRRPRRVNLLRRAV